MSQRITNKDLNNLIERLNGLTNSPLEPYSSKEGGGIQANIGNFHLSGAYGGVCVHRMHNLGGGVTTPIIAYHTTKKELYALLHAFIKGIELGQGYSSNTYKLFSITVTQWNGAVIELPSQYIKSVDYINADNTLDGAETEIKMIDGESFFVRETPAQVVQKQLGK